MKHCHQCNLDFPPGYRFCGSCGGSLNDSLRCQGCGDLVESKWAFCTSCGKTLSSSATDGRSVSPEIPEPASIPATVSLPSPASTTAPMMTEPRTLSPPKKISTQEWYAAPDLFDEEDETTATSIQGQELVPKPTVAATQLPAPTGNGKAAPTLTMLSAYGDAEKTAPPEWQGRHAILIGLLLLVFFGLLGFGGWYWWTHRILATQSPPPAETAALPAAIDTASSSASKPTNTSEAKIASDGADQAWKQLREKRIGAKPSDAKAVINSLEETEKKYPRDYRFPYERAKLSIEGITSHHEAFGTLALAAEKAIDNGRAQEMLDILTAEQDGDFYKLSRGHREWQALIQALSNKDKRGLSELHH